MCWTKLLSWIHGNISLTMKQRALQRTPSGSDIAITNTFTAINERPVDDISLDFFYKPHTITLMLLSIIGVMYCAFVRCVKDLLVFIQKNYWFNKNLVITSICLLNIFGHRWSRASSTQKWKRQSRKYLVWHIMCHILLSHNIGAGIPEWTFYATASGCLADAVWCFCAVLTWTTVSYVSELQINYEYIVLVGSELEKFSHWHGQSACDNSVSLSVTIWPSCNFIIFCCCCRNMVSIAQTLHSNVFGHMSTSLHGVIFSDGCSK